MNEIAIVALGSNLGDSASIVTRAIAELQSLSEQPVRASSLWQSEPVDCPPGSPPFINAVALLEPRAGETPETLLHKLRALEERFGPRPRTIRNEPRRLDLDLIAFGSRVVDTPELTLAHPRAHLRRFVLQPLAEVAPDVVLPGQAKTVAQLLTGLNSSEHGNLSGALRKI